MPNRAWSALLVVACVGGCTADSTPQLCPGRPLPQPPGLDPWIEARVDARIATMSLEEKVAEMYGTSRTPDADQLWRTGGALPFRMIDGPRGVGIKPATSFPVSQARGAAWDRELERAIGLAIGAEAAAYGANVLLAPTINVLRHPAWGRAQETYGEDPYHVGELGAAFVVGAQRHVIATPKHLALNSIEDTRFHVSVEIDERTLREVYLPQFAKAVAAGAGAVMTAHNRINGTYASEHSQLLRDILKGEWGFSGFVMSDWLEGTHSAATAVKAGLDMEMPTGPHFQALRGEALRCKITLSYIDDSVRRILRTKLRFGLDEPQRRDRRRIEHPAHAVLALRAARESIVLLKNDGVLPLGDRGTGAIAVVGALAGVANLGDKGSSHVEPSQAISPLAGLVARFGKRVVALEADVLGARARATIAAAEVAVVVVGLTADDEGENIPGSGRGDRRSLALSAKHQALIADVAALNPRSIVILEGGSAVIVEPWVADVAALVMAWYPGQAGGIAIAEILAGDINPSGRLPVSFPRHETDLPRFDRTSREVRYDLLHGYRYLDAADIVPAFPFGFGLSYGAVTYDALQLRLDARAVHATITLTSIDRAGDEVVQLYVEPPRVGVPRARRELRGFARVPVRPGARATVTIEVPFTELARWDDERWVVDAGTWMVRAGPSSRDLPLAATFTRAN